MEIYVDPLNEKNFKLIKRATNLWWLIFLIFVAGILFVVLASNISYFVPFLVIIWLVYILSGNSFEIGIDPGDQTVYRKGKDMLNIMAYQNRIKIDEIQKICIVREYRGDKHTADRLVLHLGNHKSTALCSVSYEPDYDLLLRFTRGLAQVLDKDYESYQDNK